MFLDMRREDWTVASINRIKTAKQILVHLQSWLTFRSRRQGFIFLPVVYLTNLSVIQSVLRREHNHSQHELESMWKEAVMP
jgi:hypothetical protein